MNYITTRIALEAFEYSPNGQKPDWWINMVKTGRAYEYGETKNGRARASFTNRHGEQIAYVGDRIYIDETGFIGAMSGERFAVCCKAIDNNKDAAPMFIKRIKDAVYKFMDQKNGK